MDNDIKGLIASMAVLVLCCALVWEMTKDGKIAMLRRDWAKALFAYSVAAVIIGTMLFAAGKPPFS